MYGYTFLLSSFYPLFDDSVAPVRPQKPHYLSLGQRHGREDRNQQIEPSCRFTRFIGAAALGKGAEPQSPKTQLGLVARTQTNC